MNKRNQLTKLSKDQLSKLTDSSNGDHAIKTPRRYNYDLPEPRKSKAVREWDSPKFTAIVKERALTIFGLGLDNITAANYAEIDPRTLERWLDRGKVVGPDATGPDAEYYKFYIAREHANAMAKVSHISALITLGKKGDRAAITWLLEKQWPEEYGPRLKVDTTIQETAKVKITIEDLRHLSNDELDTALTSAKKLEWARRRAKAIDA